MVEILSHLNIGCHREEKKCFHVNGKHMPICARCVGTIIGHCSAILISFFIAFSFEIYFISAGFLIIMFADWWMQNKLHGYHNNFARLFTGILGGFAVAISVITFILWIF
jgi:uncharacterized membrane protein